MACNPYLSICSDNVSQALCSNPHPTTGQIVVMSPNASTFTFLGTPMTPMLVSWRYDKVSRMYPYNNVTVYLDRVGTVPKWTRIGSVPANATLLNVTLLLDIGTYHLRLLADDVDPAHNFTNIGHESSCQPDGWPMPGVSHPFIILPTEPDLKPANDNYGPFDPNASLNLSPGLTGWILAFILVLNVI